MEVTFAVLNETLALCIYLSVLSHIAAIISRFRSETAPK